MHDGGDHPETGHLARVHAPVHLEDLKPPS
jgi:hypothetical protein